MYLTRELLLPYQGLDAFDGLCHIRTYEQIGRLPAVIAGGLDDNPGSSIGLVIELVAAAVQRSEFPDGREFNLIEHYRGAIDGRPVLSYSLVHFDHHSLQDSPDIESEFRGPRWAPIKLVLGNVVRYEDLICPAVPATGRAGRVGRPVTLLMMAKRRGRVVWDRGRQGVTFKDSSAR
jgi:hypothetical protein